MANVRENYGSVRLKPYRDELPVVPAEPGNLCRKERAAAVGPSFMTGTLVNAMNASAVTRFFPKNEALGVAGPF
jgi:hypothetical protein